MDDPEIARRALELQTRGRDYRLVDIPGYAAWSERKLKEGVSDALIAHLDAADMWLLPEDVANVPATDFDDMLEALIADLDLSE